MLFFELAQFSSIFHCCLLCGVFNVITEQPLSLLGSLLEKSVGVTLASSNRFFFLLAKQSCVFVFFLYAISNDWFDIPGHLSKSNIRICGQCFC